MKETLIKLQIESLEQQLKVLKSKLIAPKTDEDIRACLTYASILADEEAGVTA